MATRTFLLRFSIAFAGVASALSASGAPLLPTNVAGIFSYPAPPSSFDAFTASTSELASYGLPPRPPSAQLRARKLWDVLVRTTRIQPVLQPTLVVNGPARRAARSQDANAQGSTQYSLNWSGQILLNAANGYGQGAYAGLAGTFNVPVAGQAFGTCTGGWDYLSSWVGIDGWNSDDVLQAGTESDAYCNGNTSQQFYTAWIEWYPASETRITNLPVLPGDVVLSWISAESATTGRAIIVNETTNQSVLLNMTAPPGITLKGDSAEWIMERPTTNKVTSTMSNYVEAWMSDETATVLGDPQNGDFGAPPPGSTPFLVTMLNANYGQVISSAMPVGDSAAVFKDAGPAK